MQNFFSEHWIKKKKSLKCCIATALQYRVKQCKREETLVCICSGILSTFLLPLGPQTPLAWDVKMSHHVSKSFCSPTDLRTWNFSSTLAIAWLPWCLEEMHYWKNKETTLHLSHNLNTFPPKKSEIINYLRLVLPFITKIPFMLKFPDFIKFKDHYTHYIN